VRRLILYTILVTGASSGIGRVTALRLAQSGYDVIATGRSESRLKGLVVEANDLGLELKTFSMDICSSARDIRDAIESNICSERVDVLINNAGYGLWGPLETLSDQELTNQFQTNVFGLISLTQTLLPQLRLSDNGKIINVSSVLGRLGTPFNGAYVSSKFALEGLSESLRHELAPFGVSVTLVEPGYFDTGFQSSQVRAEKSNSPAFPYRDLLNNYLVRRSRYIKPSNPVKVARVIEKIIRSRSPRFRYVVGVDAKLAILAKALLPDKLFAYFVRKATIGK